MAISDNLWLKIVENVSSIEPEILAKITPSIEKGVGSSVNVNVFKDAMNMTSDPINREYILQTYLALAYGDKIDNFDGCLKGLTHIFSECGLNEGENPFITFMKLDGGKYLDLINPKSIITLNNLYADDIIDGTDIQGRSDMRTDYPIFKEKFYEVEDPEFTLKCYDWLSNLSKLKQLNYGAIANWPKLENNDVLRELSRTVANEEKLNNNREYYVTSEDPSVLNKIDVLTFRTAFINGGRGEMSYDIFRPTEELRNIMSLAAKEDVATTDSNMTKPNETKRNKTSLDDIKKSISDLSKTEKINLIKNMMSTSGIDKYDIEY